jgi:hypothetical protein
VIYPPKGMKMTELRPTTEVIAELAAAVEASRAARTEPAEAHRACPQRYVGGETHATCLTHGTLVPAEDPEVTE